MVTVREGYRRRNEDESVLDLEDGSGIDQVGNESHRKCDGSNEQAYTS
jgi:hypothetical protein